MSLNVSKGFILPNPAVTLLFFQEYFCPNWKPSNEIIQSFSPNHDKKVNALCRGTD